MSKPGDDRKRVETAVQSCYSTWGETYYDEYYGKAAPYPPVHADLIRGLVIEAGAKTVLDAGCGPVSFLRHLTEDGLDLYGFDLTVEMVEEGKRVFEQRGLDGRRIWQGSVLDPQAYRGSEDFPNRYDAAVCVGVLPHVAEEYDEVVFRNLFDALDAGGTAIVEARNQLFGLFTFNRPSYDFVRNELIRADELLARAGEKRSGVEAALEKLKAQFRMDLPPVRRGKAGEPGYDEVLSRTHNPLTAREQFMAAGFRDVRALFYHYHAVPPMVAGEFQELFMEESMAMEDPSDWRGYFMASAFVLAGRKP